MPISEDSLQAIADRLPPILCRLMAWDRKVRGRRLKTLRELSEESGLSWRQVTKISRKTTWAGIKIDHADKYARACGINLAKTRNQRFYIAGLLRSPRGLKPLLQSQIGTRAQPKVVSRLLAKLQSG